jgi:hypothetical protein
VEIALEPPALGVARLDDPRSGGAQLLEALAQLGVEVGDVAAQQPAQEGEGHQPGADEGGPPGGVAGPGASRRHEQEGQQRADVDGRELEPLEGVGAAPAPDRADEHDHEQREVEQRAEDARDPRQRRVGMDGE